jgi:hypothetical protein
MWNEKRTTFEMTIIEDYVGFFLFGFIPIYLIKIDSSIEYDTEKGTVTSQKQIYKKFGHCINGGCF